MSWSAYQEAIFAYAAQAQRQKRLVVRATAGSGKTTTMVELAKRLQGSHVSLAFNKAIKLELEARGVNAFTFHGLCTKAVLQSRSSFGSHATIDKDKVRDFVWNNFSEEQGQYYGSFVIKLVGLAKNAGIGCLVEDTEEEWSHLADHHDLELGHVKAEWAEAIDLSRRVLAWSNTARDCDFDDILYFAVKDGVVLDKYDNVIVDEGQDTNAIQIAIIWKILNDNSDLYVVGDSAQAIYGFRGADSEALGNIILAFKADELPLTVSYRCAKAIVKYASQFGVIEAAPNAIEGAVNVSKFKDVLTDLGSKDLIVARCTRPLIEAAYKLLKARKPAYVMGREIGQGLKSLIERMNAKGIDRLVAKLNEFTAREVEKLVAKKKSDKAANVQDKTDCILFLIEALPEMERTIPELLCVITELFADKSNATVLATIHKAKGLESERVIWLDHDFVNKYARQEWQQDQERNLKFVAATRAKIELILIPSPKKEKEG